MGLDPGHFHVYTCKLCGMSGSKSRVSSKYRANCKYAIHPCRHCHLFIELWRLSQRSSLSKVIQCEEFGAPFAGTSHQFWSVYLYKSIRQPKVAHRPFNCGLDLEY